MYKVAWLARFPQGLTKEEGRRHWSERHAPMCVKTPGIDRYVQNHVMGPLANDPDGETHFDGYSCGWWSDEDAFRASMDTDEWRALVADGDNVFDMSWLEGMSAQVEEHVIIDGEPGPYKVAWVAKFKPGMSNADGRAHWANTHGPIIADLPDIDRYVQNHCVSPVGGGGEARDPLRFDGFSEAWFADEAAYLRAVTSPTWEVLHQDGFNVFDPDLLWGVKLDERVVQAGTLAGAI